MGRRERFEYWPELVLVLVMLTVLMLNITLFESLWSSGEGGGQATSIIQEK